jgi:hypothetical protein
MKHRPPCYTYIPLPSPPASNTQTHTLQSDFRPTYLSQSCQRRSAPVREAHNIGYFIAGGDRQYPLKSLDCDRTAWDRRHLIGQANPVAPRYDGFLRHKTPPATMRLLSSPPASSIQRPRLRSTGHSARETSRRCRLPRAEE